MSAPSLTVKNVKVAEFASEETLCFEASLYVNGKRAAVVSNDGHGGSHSYHVIDRAAFAQAEAAAAGADLPFDFERLDQLVDNLVGDYEEQKRLRRLAKRYTLFRLPGDDPNALRTLKGPKPYDAASLAYIERKYPDAEVVDPR